MSFVIGRGSDAETVQAGKVGTYRALDGSDGADLYVDLDGPHAMLVVGKRGYGKSYTLGVLAEELARASGVAPVIVDPMGAFATLADGSTDAPVPVEVVAEPTVAADALDPRSWCALLGLSPESGAGSLVWRAARESATLEGMRERVAATDAPGADKRAATNHIALAESWGAFDPDGLDAAELAGAEVTVVDVSGLDMAPMNAVCRAVAEALYRARIDETIDRLPWLLLDEAHAFFAGVAADALHTVLTRGRAPGVSLVLATQRPSSLSETAISQSDVLVAHRLTAESDLEALEAAQPTYVRESLADRLPTDPGSVVVIDDATETIHAARIRRRHTPHGGGSPRAREVADRP
ncbi:ATP-binding protein [Halopiger thermotolerans]